MNEVIIYPNDNNEGLVFVYPCECNIKVHEIARKDVPPGKPFLIVDRFDLPDDSTFIDAWTADFSQPHGVGIGAEAWFAEQEAKKLL